MIKLLFVRQQKLVLPNSYETEVKYKITDMPIWFYSGQFVDYMGLQADPERNFLVKRLKPPDKRSSIYNNQHNKIQLCSIFCCTLYNKHITAL